MEASKRNDFSRRIVKELEDYYNLKGIYPARLDVSRFHCSNQDLCPGDLARGMQCHVGYQYGDTIKVVVSAMDCGGGGADVIEDRTSNVIRKHGNPHMRGTLRAVSLILRETQDDSVDFIAMTNACKCCRLSGTKHMDKKYYENCSIHKLEEFRILNPDIILFQGKEDLSLAGCKHFLSKIDDPELDLDLKEYLKKYSDGIIDCFAVICIHPSARGRHIRKRNEFYNELFPRIADYLRKKLN